MPAERAPQFGEQPEPHHSLDSYLAIAGVVAVLGSGGAGLTVDVDAAAAQAFRAPQERVLPTKKDEDFIQTGLAEGEAIYAEPSFRVEVNGFDLGTTQAQTTTDPALQSCISSNLSQPQVTGTFLKRKDNLGYQSYTVDSELAANPCPDEVSRLYEVAVYFQSRNPHRRDRYFRAYPYISDKPAGQYDYDGTDPAFNFSDRSHYGPKNKKTYQCYRGKGVEHAQGRFRKTLYDANTKKLLARAVTKFPIKVGRPC